MEIAITIVYLAIFTYLVFRLPFFRVQGWSPWWPTALFLLKVTCGTALTLIYTYYYANRHEADIYKYFDDARVMYRALHHRPTDYFRMLFGIGIDNEYFEQQYLFKMDHWYRPYYGKSYNDSHLVIRFNALLWPISRGIIHVHTIVMCFLSFIGLTALYKGVAHAFKGREKPLWLGIMLIPSVLFWGSGVLKEGLLLLGMGLMIYSFFSLTVKPRHPVLWVLLLLSAAIVGATKMYILLALIPGMTTYIWVKNNPSLLGWKYAVMLLFFLAIGLQMGHLFPGSPMLQTLAAKQKEFICLADWMGSGSQIDIPLLSNHPSSLFMAAPTGFMNTLCRPWLWESNSMLMLLSAIENTLVLVLLAWGLLGLKKQKINSPNLLGFLISFVLISYILIGITTPVLGALVRYRMPMLPALLAIILLLNTPEFLYRRFPKLK